MLTVSRLVCATLAMLGFSSLATAYVNPGVNLGAGTSVASAFLTAIDFVEPEVLLNNAKNPELSYNLGLLRMIADESMVAGPYTVTNVSVPWGVPPNGDVHSYYSWAPYWWPDPNCAFLNTDEFMTKCKYVQRDGEFNPDLYHIRQKPAFINVAADSVSLALAAEAFGEYDYLAIAARNIRYFFLNPDTFMRPNLEYTQIRRGTQTVPWVGVQSGVLDGRWLMYITTALNILNEHVDEILPGQTEVIWSHADYEGMQTWMSEMTHWYNTAKIAIGASNTKNNHATWYYAQASTYAYFSGNNTETARILKKFLTGIYQTFFAADGSQPLELARTRPFHYSVFNLEPLICMAKLGDKVGVDVWGWPSKAGNNTIQKAVDFLLEMGTDEEPVDLVQHLYAVRGRYGDPTGKYTYWIANITAQMVNPPIYPLWAYPLYTPPTSTASFTPAPNAAGWMQQDAVVVIVAREGAAQTGVKQLNVTVNGALSEIQYETLAAMQTHTVVLSTEGTHTVAYCAENGQGDNEECGDEHVVTVSIDKTAPVVSFTDANSPSFNYDIADTVNIQCSATDALSGVASSSCSNFNSAAVNLPLAPATTALSAQAVDYAGNTAALQARISVTPSFDGLCTVTRRFLSFNTLAANKMCLSLATARGAVLRLVRNAALEAYILEARLMILGRLTHEQGNLLIAGAKALKA